MLSMNGSNGKVCRVCAMRKVAKSIALAICLVAACWMAVTQSCDKAKLKGPPAQVANLRTIIFSPNCLSTPCPPVTSAEKRVAALKQYVEIRRKSGEEIDLRNADLVGLDLSEVNLSSADLSFAKLGDCSQYDYGIGKGYSGAVLKGANLKDAILIGAYLCGADISGAKLEGAQITQDQIDSAKGDKETLLPTEFRKPSSWSGAL
jgi:uncharacterized protein YjbI with pentapeptide repeats